MVFSSTIFLFCFFPIVLLMYYIPSFVIKLTRGGVSDCKNKSNLGYKNIILLIASILFYAYGEGILVLLILGSICFNYFVGLGVSEKNTNKNSRRIILTLAVIANLLVLVFYKYLDFLISNVNFIFKTNIPLTFIGLPIGISFFTFQAISYIVDVYWGRAKVQSNPLKVGLYISLFPQLVAGPIVRYESIAEQMDDRVETLEGVTSGVSRFITGLVKKVLVADTMAIFADRIFTYQNGWNDMTVGLAWLGAICYTLQVYYDFSGYSDMAIGLGKMFGFEFEENFNYPYIAKSIAEFWRRWHISLSTWFRDYVFYPVQRGKLCTFIRNKCKKKHKKLMKILPQLISMIVVWSCTGIWHGANWTFLCWGLMFFFFQFVEEISGFGKKWKLPSFVCHIYTMAVVIISFVIFRSSSMYMACFYIAQMFGIRVTGVFSDTALLMIKDNWMFFVAALLFITPVGQKLKKWPWIQSVLLFLAFMLAILYILKGSYSPFIYFHF